MPPKKKDPPPAGQRSIAAFFSPKLAGPKNAAAPASKLSKPAGAADTAAAKATAADGPSKAPLCASAKPLLEYNAPADVAVPAAAQAASGSAASSAAGAQQRQQGEQQAPAQPSGSSAAAAGDGAAAGKAGAALVGKGIKVYWADDKDWYLGTITAFDGTKHKVEYEDGDEEWVDLASEKYKLLQGKQGAAKKRKAQVVESEDDAESAPDSGSDYQASMEQDGASDEESLADEVDSGSDTSPAPGKAKTSAGRTGKGGANGNGKLCPGTKSTPGARAGGKGKKQAAATPNGVAVDSGGLGLTPSGAAAAAGAVGGKPSVSKPAGAAAAVGTAGRPPRPPGTAAKTPGVKTPGTGGVKTPASALRSALDGGTPGSAAGGAATPGSTLKEAMAADAERFSARDAARFTFLHPNNVRDGSRRRPGEPGYDPSTVYVPPDWLKANKVSEGQKQWWEFKSRHYDAVLLFKMGKFYEMFEMDAHVGAEVLGLSYMKGDQPHCGFPEAAYHQMAETLARAGRRVVVIEQTETPDQLAVRNEERRRQGLKKEMVVRREQVAVLTRGTLTDPEMLGAHPDAVFLMSVAELPVPSSYAAAGSNAQDDGGGVVRPRVWLGACAVDVATGQVLLGQWLDDDMRSQLRSVLTALQPAELVLPRGEISGSTRKVLLGLLRNPRLNELPLGPRFWDAPTAWQHLETGGYFGQGGAVMPAVLESMLADKDGYQAAGAALGGCLAFLKDAMLDKQVLSAGRVELLSEAFGVGAGGSVGGGEQGPAYMALDGAALENLEVLENGDGGLQGTLLAAVDNCVTPAGRRRLRQWLCRPLFRIAHITERQDAVHDLTTVAEGAAAQARKLFAGLSDLERALARLTAAGSGHGSAREAPHVILYEDVARKRVQGFAAVLRGLHRIQEAMQLFQDLGGELSSSLLRQLTTPGEGLFPDMEAALRDMSEATDWDEAESSGRVVPRQGVDEAFDEAEGAIAVAEGNLQEYLQEVRRSVKGCSTKEINYVSLNKDSHVLEVPEGASVPRDWEPMQGKKGWKRYMSEDLRQLAKALAEAQEQRERAMSGILQGLMGLFAERKEVWAAAVDCTAQLDALMSLAVAAACSGGPMCRPTLVPWSPADGGSPVFRARGLCHPAGLAGSGGVFVPNDVQLGGDAPGFVVLTGPNMGGKSTLLRQACLACLLAQVGGWVPADSLELSPVDAVYVRMGARDRIMLGQSTFFVELAETSAALNRATPRSLVALDELGRGTATSDGAAIAAAVLDYLAKTVKCRGLFATHYHRLSDSHAADPDVALKHMACEVTPAQEEGGVDEVTFLYKLVPGPCPKSYGVNVARLAGLPDSVVRRAAQVAEQLEHHKGLPAATQAAQLTEQQQQEAGNEGVQPMDLDGSGAAAGGKGGEEGEAAALLQRAVALAQHALHEGGLPREQWSELQAEARQLAGVAC